MIKKNYYTFYIVNKTKLYTLVRCLKTKYLVQVVVNKKNIQSPVSQIENGCIFSLQLCY